jgi:hypothetical protein
MYLAKIPSGRELRLILTIKITKRGCTGKSFRQFAQFPADAFSSHAGPMPREPRPVQLEARPMPTNNSFRLNKNQGFPPSIPEPPQHHSEQSVRGSKPRLRKLLFEDAELLPKSQVFQE